MSDGESPELARHVEVLDRIHEVSLGITVTSGLVKSLGEKLDDHAEEDRRNFTEQTRTSEALRATLLAHIETCTEKPKKNWKAISAAIVAAGGALTAFVKSLGPSN